MDDRIIDLAREDDEAAVNELLSSIDAVITQVVTLEFPKIDAMYDVDDVVSEIRYRIVTKLDRYDSGRELTPWVREVAKNHIRDLIRHLKSQKFRPESGWWSLDAEMGDETGGRIDNLYDHLAGGLPPADRKLSRKEARTALYAAIAMLDEPNQSAVKLRYLEAKSVGDVAERIDKSYKSTEAILGRAKQQLKVHLGRASQYLSTS